MWLAGVTGTFWPWLRKSNSDDIEIGEEMLPVGQVAVDGVAIAMAEEQTHAFGIAVPAHLDARAAIERHLEHLHAALDFIDRSSTVL